MQSFSLQPHPILTAPSGPVLLLILDGLGIGKTDGSNAWHLAQTPFLDSLKDQPIYTTLAAHGKAVGMPSHTDMGNSEVGHNTLGSGRIINQGSALVKKALASGTLFKNPNWKKGLSRCINTSHTLHFIGLLSDGNVHNHISYQLDLIKEAAAAGVKKMRLHCLLDGRDVDARSALRYLKTLNNLIETLKKEHIDIAIASGGGRMVMTMDRYNADWEMVERGYNAHVHGIGSYYRSAEEAIQTAYDSDPLLTDQYIPPFVITKDNHPIGRVCPGDSVFLTNFRGDRAIELSQAFTAKDPFQAFNRVVVPNVFFAGMLQYDADLCLPPHYLVEPPQINDPLSRYLCTENIRSFAISETQKYGHVTYFWNGNKSGYVDKNLEDYFEIPSDTCPFDQAPAMKAFEITEKTLALLQKNTYSFGRVNFPNGDMVGHTGHLEATIASLEVIDQCSQKLVEAVYAQKGRTIIVADHGNADEMYTIKNNIKTVKTSHTLNPVPFAIFDANHPQPYSLAALYDPGLANVAATICNLLGYQAPSHFYPSIIQTHV